MPQKQHEHDVIVTIARRKVGGVRGGAVTVKRNRFLAVVAAAVAITASAALAQTTRQYDRQGRLTGWSTQSNNEIRHYDQSGRLTGRTILRDNEAREQAPGGALTGRTYFLPDGRVRHFNERGRLLGESR